MFGYGTYRLSGAPLHESRMQQPKRELWLASRPIYFLVIDERYPNVVNLRSLSFRVSADDSYCFERE